MRDPPVDADGVVEALVALDVLLHGDGFDALTTEDSQRMVQLVSLPTAIVPDAPAPLRGLRISG